MKRITLYMLFGALLGAVVATLVAPGWIIWYNSPGTGQTQSLCNLADESKRVMSSLVQKQALGMAIGASLFLAIGAFVSRPKRKSPPPPGLSAPASTPAARDASTSTLSPP